MKKIVYLILTILWMTVIFLFSNQPADDSTKLSNGFINNTIIRVYRLFDNNKSDEEIIEIYSHPIRKMAHFTIYLILGILVFNLLKQYDITKIDIIYLSIVLCFIYASSDEVHQAFIIGRSCEIKDVFIDVLGSTVGVFIIKKIYSIKDSC